MARYKVVAGKADLGKGKEARQYKSGDIIESELPLDELFVNKFERVPDDESLSKGKIPSWANNPLMAKETKVPAKGDKQMYEEDAVDPEEAGEEEENGEEEVEEEEEQEEEQEATTHKSKLGKDVTEEFPKAAEFDFSVFRKKKGKKTSYYVTNSSDPETALNEEALKKKDVESFIDEQGKE